MNENEMNVHTEHCCRYHGCKYNDETCPVTLKQQTQSYPCELCEWVKGEFTFPDLTPDLEAEMAQTYAKGVTEGQGGVYLHGRHPMALRRVYELLRAKTREQHGQWFVPWGGEHHPGWNAEECPACVGRTDLVYPFICPGYDQGEGKGKRS